MGFNSGFKGLTNQKIGESVVSKYMNFTQLHDTCYLTPTN